MESKLTLDTLTQLRSNPTYFNTWEISFLNSLIDWIGKGKSLSPKQYGLMMKMKKRLPEVSRSEEIQKIKDSYNPPDPKPRKTSRVMGPNGEILEL